MQIPQVRGKGSQSRIVSAIKWLELKPTAVDAPANKRAIPDPAFFTVPAALAPDFIDRLQDAVINYLDAGYDYHELQAAADLRGIEEGYLGAGGFVECVRMWDARRDPRGLGREAPTPSAGIPAAGPPKHTPTEEHREMMMRYLPQSTMIVLIFLASLASDARAQSRNPIEDLNALRVEKEDWCTKYDRQEYPYPRSIEQAIIRVQGLFSPYDLTCFHSPRESDVEHIVAIAEAHSSGMCSRSGEEKATFASDLLNLTLATPELNRGQKIAKDAAEWLPEDNTCWYAARIVAVKRKYRLSVDKAEKRALSRVLRRCRTVAMATPACNKLP